MATLLRSYQIPELPDPSYPRYQLTAGGDARLACWQGCGQILRCIANLPPASVSLSLLFVFTPQESAAAAQSRLAVHLLAHAEDEQLAGMLALLLERGPLVPYYNLQPVPAPSTCWERLQAVCHVVRREDAIEPIHAPEVNDRIPRSYYSIRSFEPNEKNDYLLLDRVLGKLPERAVIEISVSPTDVSAEVDGHTRYQARMESINRSWDRDEDDEWGTPDYLGTGQGRPLSLRTRLRPLRREDPLADDILRRQRKFHESLIQPNLCFRIKVHAETVSAAQLLASVVAESSFEEGTYRLFSFDRENQHESDLLLHDYDLQTSDFSTQELLFGNQRHPYTGLVRLAHLAPAEELIGAFRLPVASCGSPCCIRKNTDPPGTNEQDLIVIGYDEEPATNGSGVPRGIPVEGLTKHVFFSGVPGSGKTTGAINQITQFHERGIPFLVIEAVKTEYRQLKSYKGNGDTPLSRLASDLRIYTPGNEAISPFRFNPLARCSGIPLDEHIENCMQCFYAAMPMSGPLPALLLEGLERIYEDHPDPEDPPIMGDLLAAVEHVLAEKGYSPETNSDIRGALDVRLGSLTHGSIGRIFQCRANVPDIAELVAAPTVIELDSLGADQTCLMSLFILMRIREHIKTTSFDGGGIRLVILLEEAHLVVGRSTEASPSEDNADPKSHAAQFVVKMLAELRALGVGVVILDQLPSAVAAAVTKNTSSKAAYRQVANDDREELGGAMLFGQLETEEIARLTPGEAYFYTEGYHGPRRIRTVNPFVGIEPGDSLLRGALLPYLQDEDWFIRAASQRQNAELDQLCRSMDAFDAYRMTIVKQAVELLASYPRILSGRSIHRRSAGLNRLLQEARCVRRELANTFDVFVRRKHRPLLGNNAGQDDAESNKFRANLIDRFQSVISPDTQSCLGKLDGLISRCKTKRHELQGV